MELNNLLEQRNALAAELNPLLDGLAAGESKDLEADEKRSNELSAQIDELDKRLQAGVRRLEDENRSRATAEAIGNLTQRIEKPASSGEELTFRSLVADHRAALESRATVTVPAALQTSDEYKEPPFIVGRGESFWSLIDFTPTNYMVTTETLHAFGSVTFSPGTEATTATESEPPIETRVLTTSKEDLRTSLSNETLENVIGADAALRQRIDNAYLILLRNRVNAAINAAGTATPAAAGDITAAELIRLINDVSLDFSDDMVVLASPKALGDLNIDKGNDAFYFDPVTGINRIQGRPVFEARGLGASTSGDTAVAFVHPRTIRLKSSGLRVRVNDSVAFYEDSVGYHAGVYVGAGINDTDYVVRLTLP